jgi:hypothetical protein
MQNSKNAPQSMAGQYHCYFWILKKQVELTYLKHDIMILSAITGKTVIENGVVGQELTICLTPV